MTPMLTAIADPYRLSGDQAQDRVKDFAQLFGEPHLYFAYHAAFPMALTPDLLNNLYFTFVLFDVFTSATFCSIKSIFI